MSVHGKNIRAIRIIRAIRDPFSFFSVIRDPSSSFSLIREIRVPKGFTLLEVLISMAIIGVGLIALVTLFPLGLRSSRLAGDFTTAALIGQQALDNIRAASQVYDPADMIDEDNDGDRFDDPDGNGLGYYDLPVSAVKGFLSPLRFPVEPSRSQTWTITITATHNPPGTIGTFNVTSSITGLQTATGSINSPYKSDNNEISFVLADNPDGSVVAPYGWGTVFNENFGGPSFNSDIDYPEFEVGDRIVINVEMRGGNPYYWHAMRAPVTEDLDLDGILDGRYPGTGAAPQGRARSDPHNRVQEDIGLDLVPDFWDSDMRDIGSGTAGYQDGIDKRGEFASAAFPMDAHGDNRYAYTTSIPYWWDTTNTVNANGMEGNAQIDAWDDNSMQKVTVTVGWREGSQDRTAIFSASIANQYR